MKTYTEGNLKISFPSGMKVRKFDDSSHRLSHCMKAVDFIVELRDKYLFIEFKDPEHPEASQDNAGEFAKGFLAGNIDKILRYKYRDSFLYEWAAKRADKPIYYYVLVAMAGLTEADLLNRTDALRSSLPVDGPPSGEWKRTIAKECAVFNIATWNKSFSNYPVSRVEQ